MIFSGITDTDRADRDTVMAQVMADERLTSGMQTLPFDGKRMIFGGVEVFAAL